MRITQIRVHPGNSRLILGQLILVKSLFFKVFRFNENTQNRRNALSVGPSKCPQGTLLPGPAK